MGSTYVIHPTETNTKQKYTFDSVKKKTTSWINVFDKKET